MADAVVTLKLTPDELRTIIFAIEQAMQSVDEIVKAMSPHDGRAMRAQLVKMSDLKARL